jgi:hypothetical protein
MAQSRGFESAQYASAPQNQRRVCRLPGEREAITKRNVIPRYWKFIPN